MNKKAEIQNEYMVMLIIFIVVLAVFFIAFITYSQTIKSSSNKDAIKTWVSAKAITKGVALGMPPVLDLQDPLEINSKNDLLWIEGKEPSVYKEIANSLYDCWDAFDRGKTDFLSGMVNKKVFCFPCRAIHFSDEIKKENVQMINFNKYLNEQHIAGEGTQTYVQYLANDPVYKLSDADLKDDKIGTSKDLYVYFFATSGKEWLKLAGSYLYDIAGVPDIIFGSSEEVFNIKQTLQEGTYKPIPTTKDVTYLQGTGYVLNMKTTESKEKVESNIGIKIGKTLGKLLIPVRAGIALYDLNENYKKLVINEKGVVSTVVLTDQEAMNTKCNQLQE